ncbi:MAG TPA: hypothetical protein VGG23_03125, partial [Acidimicrobiales bacterium]
MLGFEYDDAGRLTRFTEASGSPVARSFGFGYAPGGSTLTSVADPLGHRTVLGYFGRDTDALHRGRVSTLTDRDGGVTAFDYAPAPAGGPGAVDSVLTDPDGHRTVLAFDGLGRAIRSTNALGQITDVAWDDDDNVVRLREADGAVSTWVYDPLTGDPLTIADAAANAAAAAGRAPAATTLTYRTSLGGHIADLVEKDSPEGRRWTFALDAYGEPASVTDPVGNAPGPNSGEHSSLRYDAYGELVESVDDAGDATRFADFTAAGYPRSTTDPLGHVSHTDYDVLGQVVSLTGAPDPGQPARIETETYDELGRPRGATVTESATHRLVEPAPIFDADDNVLRGADRLGAVTSYRYDAMGRVLGRTDPGSSANGTGLGELPLTTYAYDAAGNLLASTAPEGNTADGQGTHVERYTYDQLNRVIQRIDPLGGRSTIGYDAVGNEITQTGPRGNADADPSSWAETYTYDADHRVVRQTDAAGNYSAARFDLDGLLTDATAPAVGPDVADTDSALRRYFSATTYDADGRVLQMDVPYDDGSGTLVYHSTRYVYDRAGNQVESISPRGVASGRTDAFLTRSVYDADGRVTEQDQPYDPTDPTYHSPDPTYYTYDAVGDVTQVSAPPSGPPNSGAPRLITASTYTANGWLASSTDPWRIGTSYTYDDDGRQLSRTVANLDETDIPSATRTEQWVYNDDGSLRDHFDSGAPAGSDLVTVDDGTPNVTQ